MRILGAALLIVAAAAAAATEEPVFRADVDAPMETVYPAVKTALE